MDRRQATGRASKTPFRLQSDVDGSLSVRASATKYWSAALDARLAGIGDIHADSAQTDVDRAYRLLAHEVNSLEKLICYTRRRRNALLSVTSKLPLEVLARIFAFVQERRGEQGLGWIAVTHVCHLWRQAALEHSYLWSELTLRLGTHWCAEMARRAKSLPLVLVKDGILPRRFKTGHLIQDLLPRVRNLHATAFDQELGVLVSLLWATMPLLQTFTMESRDPQERARELRSPAMPLLTAVEPRLFVGPASRLRHFSLRGCKIIGVFPPAPCITHFEILGPRQWVGFSATFAFDSFADLLRSIVSMPWLERLVLNYQLFPRSQASQQDVARPTGPRMNFSHMKYLSIGGTVFQCASLMRHISIPSSASFCLDCNRTPDDEDLSLLLVALRPYANNFKAGGPFLSIWASPGGRETLTLWGCPNPKELKLRVECCTGDNEAGRLRSLDRPYMDLTVRGPDDNVLPAFLEVLGPENIHAVSIGGPDSRMRGPEWSNEDWIHAFEGCINVRHVRMRGLRDAESFVHALNAYHHIASVVHYRLFPRLTSVWFHDVDFVVAAGYVIPDTTGWKLTDLNGSILKMIVGRQTLETIYTTGSRLQEGHTWMLTQRVTVLREHEEGPPFIPGGLLEFASVPRHGYSLHLQMSASNSAQPFYVVML